MDGISIVSSLAVDPPLLTQIQMSKGVDQGIARSWNAIDSRI